MYQTDELVTDTEGLNVFRHIPVQRVADQFWALLLKAIQSFQKSIRISWWYEKYARHFRA